MSKKKKPVRVQHFTLYPYPSTINVVVGDTLKDAFEKVKKITDGKFCDYEPLGVAHCTSGLDPLKAHHVFLCFERKVIQHPGTIAHECVHALNAVYEYVGTEWSLSNDEPHAYAMGLLVTDVTTCVKNAR